jgi:hypothetical protein
LFSNCHGWCDWSVKKNPAKPVALLVCQVILHVLIFAVLCAAGEIKMHPWFDGIDWTDLARAKAAFVPVLDDELDTSYFEQKPVSAKVKQSWLSIPIHVARLCCVS